MTRVFRHARTLDSQRGRAYTGNSPEQEASTLSPRKPLLGVLLIIAITALALIFTSGALTKGNGQKQRLGAAA